MGGATDELRTRLLKATLELAVERSPFYRERLAEVVGDVEQLDDLGLLPTTSKQDLAAHGGEMLTSTAFPHAVGLSSGTSFRDTVAPPAIVFRTAEELESLKARETQEPEAEPDAERPLIVDIITSVHGARGTAPAPGCVLLPLEKAFHLLNLRRWLTGSWKFEGFTDRVEYLAGPLNLVRLLAVALEQTTPDALDDLRLRGVFTHGDHLSRRWRATIERILRAPIIDVFGISELAGSACMECACGFFHMPALVIPEVVDVGPAAHAGVGELVLTSLAPFQALQPLIRYRTGDLVEQGPYCELGEERGFRPIGRIVDRAAPALELAVRLPTFAVHDLVDDLPDAARAPYARLADFDLPPLYGRPLYEVSPSGNGRARLTVQLAYPPEYFRDRADEVRTLLVDALAQLAPELEVDVRLTGPSRGPASVSSGDKIQV